MSVLAGLGSLASGASQGVNNFQGIQQRAMAIQQAQLQLDAAKKQTAADAAAFANLGGLPGAGGATGGGQTAPMFTNGGPMPQSMAPGQPSVSSQPQAGTIPPQGGPPAGGPPMPQQPQPQAGQPAQSQPAPQLQLGAAPAGGPQEDPTSPQAAIKTVYSIAQEIKARNPGIDPETLMYATQKVIDMSKGIDPGLRAQASFLAANIAAQSRQAVAGTNAASRESVAGTNAQSRESVAQTGATSREAVAGTNAKARTDAATIAANGAMGRTQLIQGSIDKRYGTGQGNQAKKTAATERNKALNAQLSAAVRQKSLLKDAAGNPLPDDDPRVKKVNKDIADTIAKQDALMKTVGADQPAPAASGGDVSPATAPTASDAKGNQLTWDGKAWVPVAK